MINKSTQSKPQPFLMRPAGKDYLWGGERLKTEFYKELPMTPLAESWECSTHADGYSIAASGIHEGKSLKQILTEHPEYLGSPSKGGLLSQEGTAPFGGRSLAAGELPILVKFIDAKAKLSVQVHPDDRYAFENENGQYGKTEMWYVLDAAPDAQLIYGFQHDVSKEQLSAGLAEGTVEKYLQKVKIEKNNIFFIEPGTVHGIGAGCFIVEIQQNSNITYRIYDYNRTDKNGRLRPLHIDKAMAVVNLKAAKEPRQPLRLLKYRRGIASELLCRCEYFKVERFLLNTESSRRLVEMQTASFSFQVLLCIEGCGVIFAGENEVLNFFKGDCIFVPADSVVFKVHGKAKFIAVSC